MIPRRQASASGGEAHGTAFHPIVCITSSLQGYKHRQIRCCHIFACLSRHAQSRRRCSFIPQSPEVLSSIIALTTLDDFSKSGTSRTSHYRKSRMKRLGRCALLAGQFDRTLSPPLNLLLGLQIVARGVGAVRDRLLILDLPPVPQHKLFSAIAIA